MNFINVTSYCLICDLYIEQSLDPALLFPKPTFSLGLTQEERGVLDKVVSTCVGGVDEVGAVAISEDIQHENEEVAFGCRKSKRPKNPPQVLSRKL